MKVTFLEARQGLTKLFTRGMSGEIVVTPYPHVAEFTSHIHDVNSIKTFERHIIHYANLGFCLLKGKLSKTLNFESRAGSTNTHESTEYLVLDVDGLPNATPESVMSQIGMQDISYIVQYSASHGVLPTKGLSCHIFVLLDRPIPAPTIKDWLIGLNLSAFMPQLRLTKSAIALHYPLDITACQNDKLIFIAPPKCFPPSLDTTPPEQRIQCIIKDKSHFTFPDLVPSQHQEVQKLVNSLRGLHGEAKHKLELKRDGVVEYMPNPKIARVTGVKEGRGFIYLNIDDGDSWGYWHPEGKFEYIFNFKGEPVYRTQEFLPSYYNEQYQATLPPTPKTREYVVFCDPRADTYYKGWYDTQTKDYEFLLSGTKVKLNDFMSQYGLKAPKAIPDWTCTFDPNDLVRIDPSRFYWNRFVPSQYMTMKGETSEVPPTILAVIRHVIGNDPVLVNGFLNWVAFAFKLRRAAGTAWILQGVPGTGKGVLANHILKPLFGATNYTARRMEELEDKFNGYLENCLLCYVDEVHIGVSKRADMILANLKNQITEERITIRNMRQTAYEVPNYLNWVMSTNMAEPIKLDKEDRRFNVGVFQKKSLREIYPDTTALLKQIESELPDFASYLQNFKVNQDAVRLPIRNEARADLIDNSKTSLDVVGEAILSGDLELLASFISTETVVALQIKADRYKEIIQDLAKTQRGKLSRDELRTIFDYTVGDMPQTPAKFTRFLTHRGIRLSKIRIGERTTPGIVVEWKLTPEAAAEIATGTPTPHLKLVSEAPDGGLSGIQRSDG